MTRQGRTASTWRSTLAGRGSPRSGLCSKSRALQSHLRRESDGYGVVEADRVVAIVIATETETNMDMRRAPLSRLNKNSNMQLSAPSTERLL